MTNPADGATNAPFTLIGDTHGDGRFLGQVIQREAERGVTDLCQLGDFGFVLDNKVGSKNIQLVSDFAVKHGVTLRVLDGNHENFPLLKRLGADPDALEPVEIAPNIIYLPRGSTFDIGGRMYMAFGGAFSIDKWDREPGESWWSEEAITQEQVDRVDHSQVDVLLSHDSPVMAGGLFHYMIVNNYKVDPDSQANRDKLREVYDKVMPDEVFHGHYHHSYETVVEESWADVRVIGLSCNGQRGSWLTIDPLGDN